MLLIFVIAAVLAAVGYFPLFGLPGMELIFRATPLVNFFCGAYATEAWMAFEIESNKVWGVAIYISLLWPLAIIPAYLAAKAVAVDQTIWSSKGVVLFVVASGLGAVTIASAILMLVVGNAKFSETDRSLAGIAADDVTFVRKMRKAGFVHLNAAGYQNPVYVALKARAEDVAIFLLENGGKDVVFSTGHDNYELPLHMAASMGLTKVIFALAKSGTDINQTDSTGATVVHFAIGEADNDPNFLDFLAKQGARFAAVDKRGETPLIRLAKIEWPPSWAPKFADKLIKLGVDPKAKDIDGKTALDYAKENEASSAPLIDVIRRARPHSTTPRSTRLPPRR